MAFEIPAHRTEYHREGRADYFESVSNLILHETKTKMCEITGI